MSDLKQFTFFESYYTSFKNLPPEVVGEVINAMGAYFFDDETIELGAMSQAVFALIKPIMDSSKKKAENGRKGGAPKGNSNAKKQLKNKQKQANDNQKTSNKQAKTSDKDKDKDKDKEIKIEKENIKRKSFVPPTLDEVENYCRERNSSVNPKQFFDYFNTGGWVDSKGNKVRNWKQKILTWEKFNQGTESNASKVTPFDSNAYILSKINGGEA